MSAEKIRYKPLYLQVKEILAKRIHDGLYKQGEAIPSESSLAEELGTSVATIRQALGLLSNQGVLVKKQGKGTFVSTQKIPLSFFSWLPETNVGARILSEVTALIETRYPSLTIHGLPTTTRDAKQDLMTLISRGKAPDIIQIPSYWTSSLASIGALEPLEPLLKAQYQPFPHPLREGEYQHTLYALPWGRSPVALIVNTRMLRDAGLPPLNPPVSLDTFLTICQELDRAYAGSGRACYGLSLHSEPERDFLRLASFLSAFHGGFGIHGDENALFNTPENEAAFTWLRELIRTCHVTISDQTDLRERFTRGDIAFISDDPWIKAFVEDSTGKAFETQFQVVVNPVQTTPNSSAWTMSSALAISAQSQQKALAAQCIAALVYDPQISQAFYAPGGALPPHDELLRASSSSGEFFHTYSKQLVHASCANVDHPLFSSAMTFCCDAIRNILTHDADISTELRQKEQCLQVLYTQCLCW